MNSITFGVNKDTTSIAFVSTNTVKTGAMDLVIRKTIPGYAVGADDKTFAFTLTKPDGTTTVKELTWRPTPPPAPSPGAKKSSKACPTVSTN